MTLDRRRYAREYARRKKKDAWRTRAFGRRTCPWKSGNYICGARIEERVERDGRIGLRCRRCERREAGICRDCPAPVEGTRRRAVRCARCKERARRAALTRYRVRHHSLVNRRARRDARRKGHERAEYKRLWRQANPEKVRAQKRRAAIRNGRKHAQRAAKWRERHPDYRRPIDRVCVTCPRPVSGRQKKCDACRHNARVQAEAQLAPRRGRGRRTDRERAA